MNKKAILVLIFFYSTQLIASDHGIYLKVLQNSAEEIDSVGSNIVFLLENSGFDIQAYRNIATPNIVREDSSEQCAFRAQLIVFSSNDYSSFLSGFDNKYLIAGLLRIGLYETEEGLQVTITDPETINRIVFNDLWENDEETLYDSVITETISFKKKLVDLIHSTELGEAVELSMEPIRDDEDLKEASRDMFMMVGPMTFYTDEDQFPIIYRTSELKGKDGIQQLKAEFLGNLKTFEPTQDDIEYRYTSSNDVLMWESIAEIYSPDSLSLVIGLTRPRTEGLSFNIAGASREEDDNLCPGIDHVTAYPIEVMIMQHEDEIIVHTAREMFRMDMYFWDAGMAAFMDHMSMPAILDEAIKKALLGTKYIEN